MAKRKGSDGRGDAAGAAIEAVASPPETPSAGGSRGESYVVLARKYRPATFDDLIGQDAMVRTLRNAFAADRIAQGYMLTGVRGVGKTTTARILARALNYSVPGKVDRPTVDMPDLGVHCREIMESRHPDVIEMDAASHTGVENIRDIIEGARYLPTLARTKVYIIDEVHMLSKSAFNALLKTLEEPPPHVKFIFATTEVRKVPVTVLSRCQRFDLRRVDVPRLMAHLGKIAAQEGARAEDEALRLIARAAEGSVRDALSLLDRALATSAAGKGIVAAEDVRAMLGLADRGRLFDLLEHLLAGRTREALTAFEAMHRDGADPVETMAELAEAVHLATRIKIIGADAAGRELSAEENRRGQALSSAVSIGVLSRAWQMLAKGFDEAQRAPDAYTASEMVLIRIAHAADLPSPEDIIARLGGGLPPSSRPAGVEPRESTGGGERTSLPADGGQSRARTVAPSEAPPPQGPEDYGAFDAGEDNGETNEGDGTEPLAADAARAAPLADPRSFLEVVELVGRKRDAMLKLNLEDHVSLVRFDPAGAIEIHLLPGAPPEMANELREKLNRWTGRRWMVAVSDRIGQRPLGEVRREREARELEALKQHPAVAALLGVFPEARITSVKPVTAASDDDQAAG